MKKFSIIALTLSSFPLLAFAQQRSGYSGQTFAGLVRVIVGYINPIASILISLTMLVFLYNLMRYVWTAGDSKEHGEAIRSIGWSLLGLLVLFGMWGILSIASATLFGTSLLGGGDPCHVDPGSSSVTC
ncbi:hypothetical protein K8Q93_02280 [Candidatus Parcubacteria bacterium]|nr:hypothetical protein [Candidatus Parcubacteria bacterium]